LAWPTSKVGTGFWGFFLSPFGLADILALAFGVQLPFGLADYWHWPLGFSSPLAWLIAYFRRRLSKFGTVRICFVSFTFRWSAFYHDITYWLGIKQLPHNRGTVV
jgi:membrane-associated PAP2 superfamily phosphatase